MRKILPVMIALSVCAHTWSHDSDKAYFFIDFNYSSEQIIVYAEVPWTIRQAMFKDLDEDSNSYISYYGKNEFEYDEIMHFYIRKNFYFLKESGDTVFLKMYRKGEKKEHSHGGELEFHYLDNDVISFHNSLMMNFKKDHQNFVKILFQDQKDSLVMDQSKTDHKFDFKSKEDSKKTKVDASEMAFWLLIGMIPILLVLFLMFRKKF